MAAAYRKIGDLPLVIPVFPLDGVLLLPGGQLPLNIFEPRYLNMLDDAMSGERIIGMIQTRTHHGGVADPHRPALAPVGCAGRVTSFAETSDGRYLVTLTGVCRFKAGDELPVRTPYRQMRVDFNPYEPDLREDGPGGTRTAADIDRLLSALRRYLDHRGLAIDWGDAESAPSDALINSLAMALPFDPMEKQALLEAETIFERKATLTALLEIDAAGSDDDEPTSIQ